MRFVAVLAVHLPTATLITPTTIIIIIVVGVLLIVTALPLPRFALLLQILIQFVNSVRESLASRARPLWCDGGTAVGQVEKFLFVTCG